MDLKKYDELKKKNSKKDFERSNKGLDKWLFGLSFLGNVLSVFFSIFWVYPGFLKAIEINLIEGIVAKFIAFVITIAILVAFEIIKRFVIKNFSNEYVRNRMMLKSSGWLSVSVAIVLLSFYVSIIGSKNLGSIGTHKKGVVENQVGIEKNRLAAKYDDLKKPKLEYMYELTEINKNLNDKLNKTPIGWEIIKDGYREDIKNNDKKIEDTKRELDNIEIESKVEIAKIETKQSNSNLSIETEDIQNILLFVFIAIISEILIFTGIYFREMYEYKLYLINQDKYEKIYQKKERYKTLLTFIYNSGKLTIGDKVISGLELKEFVNETNSIPNSNKFIDSFLLEMDKLGIFNTIGKRRNIGLSYLDAIKLIDEYDDNFRILDNLK